MAQTYKIFRNIKELLSLSPAAKKEGRRPTESDLGVLTDAAMLSHNGKILWIGKETKLKAGIKALSLKRAEIKEYDLNASTVLPAFVECHTHSVFAGDRRNEFEMRNQGLSYQEIAQNGGGIFSTVKATRRAKMEELVRQGQGHIDRFVSQGVTCVEVKSGYGLDFKNEVKILKAAQLLKKAKIISTYLGPHAKSPDFATTEEYLDHIIKIDLPKIARQHLAQRADIFIEKDFFSLGGGWRYLKAAKNLGFSLTIHADQLTRLGSGVLGCEEGAQSVDHLVQINSEDITAIAHSNTVAVLLPTADLYLRMSYPPARQLIDQGAIVALATDFNPGTSPTQDLSLVGFLARSEMKMSLVEVIIAYTLNSARALGLNHERGSLELKKYCDFICLQGDWESLFYSVGEHPISSTWSQGKLIYKS